jgi:hypothetical protein
MSEMLANAGKCSLVSNGVGSSRRYCFSNEETSAGLRPSNEKFAELNVDSISS